MTPLDTQSSCQSMGLYGIELDILETLVGLFGSCLLRSVSIKIRLQENRALVSAYSRWKSSMPIDYYLQSIRWVIQQHIVLFD